MTRVDVGLKVMVVDDQAVMRKIIRRLLHQGHIDDVLEAEDGETALAVLREQRGAPPDVVICDLHMAGMDGIDFTHHLRRCGDTAVHAIPVLVLTGDREQLLREVSVQVGANKVLNKPISAPDLLHEIQAIVGFEIEPEAGEGPGG